MSMDIKQIIQHQDNLIALSASGRLYRLEIAQTEANAVPINVVIVPDELTRGRMARDAQTGMGANHSGCSLLADQAG